MDSIKPSVALPILAVSFMMTSVNAIAPSLATIQAAFPDIAPTTVQTLLTLPGLLVLPVAVLAGWLSDRVSKRVLAWVGLGLCAICGAAPTLSDSFAFIMVSRALLGVGQGIITPLGPGLIADYFDRDGIPLMMGLQNATNSLGGIVTTFAAGLLGVLGWRYSFLVYLLGIPLLLYSMLFLKPAPLRERSPGLSGQRASGSWNGLLLLIGAMFIFGLLVCPLYANIATVVKDAGVGDSATSGAIVMSVGIGTLLSSTLFARARRALGSFSLPAGILGMAAGYYSLSVAGGLALFFVGALLFGAGFGIVVPSALVKANDCAPRGNTSLAVALFMSGVNFGQFISPFAFARATSMVGLSSGRGVFYLSALLLAFCTVILALASAAGRRGRI